MIDERNDAAKAIAWILGLIIVITLLVAVSGCALFDSAGQAKYSLNPVIIKDGEGKERAVCCEVIIHNSKNIATVATSAEYDPKTGKFRVELMEEGVDAQGPAAAAAKAQTEVIKQLIPLVKTPVIK